MSGGPEVGRRRFLYASALAAGSVALGSCSSGSKKAKSGVRSPNAAVGGPSGARAGSTTKPPPKPTSFSQAPALAHAGLPPVEKRLPTNPYVLPHRWVTRGRYGGNLTTTVFGTTGMPNASSANNFFYGFSPTRWLNDGLAIGPGTAERWTANNDASEWTIAFRAGLRWSDGVPFTVDDVLFWYEDIVLPGHDAQTVPPECLSGSGKPCRMTKVDDTTLRLTYDASQPLVPDYLAAFVKGNFGQNGPAWMMPKHYLKQFHPKYNPKVPKEWDSAGGLWEQKANWITNPDCPTLTGYKCKKADNNKGVVLERNPYYYVVTPDGDQLPYIDQWTINLVTDAQVVKLQLQQGKMDFCHGTDNQLDLADVSTLSRTKNSGHYNILLWDNGTGTGSIFFFNYDYIARDPKYGRLFRDKRLMRAISYAYDRATARKSLYFEEGEITTGTMSPKAMEFHVEPEGPKMYARWRDSYKEHNPKKAEALLDAMGLKDVNHDGYREFPDGSKLTIEVPYSADIAATFSAADDQLVADMKKVGLRMVRRPIPPQSYNDAWNNGTLMSHTNAGITDGPNCLVFPQWLVPLEPSRWAPLEGYWYFLTGSPKQKAEMSLPPIKRHPPRMPPTPGGPVEKLTKIYNQTKTETDPMKRNQLVWEMMKVHIDDGPFFIGSTSNYPEVSTHHVDLKNVPTADDLAQRGFDGPWVIPAPATYDPECWYWADPDQHTA